ncbi:hypothetical protein [Cystobacter fuscus]|uniref:hypothetical protein n=1 Tax=Cystobacter fuscus TaxID=43 RepID=UPI0002ADE369
MKVLGLHDLRPEDRLWVTFDGTLGDPCSLESELEPFLQALEEYAHGWMPDVVEGKRRRKYSRASFWKALQESRDDNGAPLGLYRTKWPALDMSLWLWLESQPSKLDITINVKPLSFFADETRCHRFVEMVRAWASRYPVSHAMAHSMADTELTDSPDFGRDKETRRRDGFDKVYEVSWLNVFGPKLVESVGRERVLSTPAWRVEELPNGSVLLVLWPIAADFASQEAREAQARAHVHLRPELHWPTVLRTLRERSATLAPVEPRFPPDLAPLLSRVVDRFAIHERQRKIAEFNAWRPPEPDEWLPLRDALPPDVEDPERVLASYRLLAEHLVAMVHSDVPSIFKQTPESLTDLDFFFWREDFPETRLRHVLDEHVVPAVGAYLGQVLVEHLGGQWLPRQKLGEAQVRVGQRVWWPMVRARRYLRSRQSLLDFSLSQLFLSAERF